MKFFESVLVKEIQSIRQAEKCKMDSKRDSRMVLEEQEEYFKSVREISIYI